MFEIYREQTNFDGYRQGAPIVSNTASLNGELNNAYDCFMELSCPEIIIANSSSGRKAAEDKDNLTVRVIEDMYDISESGVFTAVSEAEARNAVKTNSIYAGFASKRSTAYEEAFLGIKNSQLRKAVSFYKDMVIMPGADNSGVTVFIRDIDRQVWVKAVTNSENAARLAKLIKAFDGTADERELIFAHELNLDKDTDYGTSLDPMLIIPANDVFAASISINVPKVYKAELSFSRPTEFSIGLANIFRYNPNTIRQYVTGDGALMFVGETGTLSVHPDGLVEYKALDASEGLAVSAASGNSLQDALYGVYQIVEQIRQLSEIQRSEGCEIRLSQMPDSIDTAKRYELGFDYYVNGTKIDFENSFAVQAAVENGAVVEFKMQVKTVDLKQQTVSALKLFDAIDHYCRENPDYTMISDAKPVYRYTDNEKETAIEWKIKGER